MRLKCRLTMHEWLTTSRTLRSVFVRSTEDAMQIENEWSCTCQMKTVAFPQKDKNAPTLRVMPQQLCPPSALQCIRLISPSHQAQNKISDTPNQEYTPRDLNLRKLAERDTTIGHPPEVAVRVDVTTASVLQLNKTQ